MRGGKLAQALRCVARPLFGFYFKNETEFHVGLF